MSALLVCACDPPSDGASDLLSECTTPYDVPDPGSESEEPGEAQKPDAPQPPPDPDTNPTPIQPLGTCTPEPVPTPGVARHPSGACVVDRAAASFHLGSCGDDPLLRVCDEAFVEWCELHGKFTTLPEVDPLDARCNDRSFALPPCSMDFDSACAASGGVLTVDAEDGLSGTCVLTPRPSGLGSLHRIDRVIQHGSPATGSFEYQLDYTTTTSAHGLLRVAGDRANRLLVSMSLDGDEKLYLEMSSEAVETAVTRPDMIDGCLTGLGTPFVRTGATSDEELREIVAITLAIAGTEEADLGWLSNGDAPREASCDTACEAAGGAGGVLIGAGLASACTGASAGVAAPGCVVGSTALGTVASSILGSACKGLFC